MKQLGFEFLLDESFDEQADNDMGTPITGVKYGNQFAKLPIKKYNLDEIKSLEEKMKKEGKL